MKETVILIINFEGVSTNNELIIQTYEIVFKSKTIVVGLT